MKTDYYSQVERGSSSMITETRLNVSAVLFIGKTENVTMIIQYHHYNKLELGLGWVSTFMDCMIDTNNKKG